LPSLLEIEPMPEFNIPTLANCIGSFDTESKICPEIVLCAKHVKDNPNTKYSNAMLNLVFVIFCVYSKIKSSVPDKCFKLNNIAYSKFNEQKSKINSYFI
jgi:hypothetical protein